MRHFTRPISIVATAATLCLGVWLSVGSVDAQEAPEHGYVGVDACGRCHRMDRTGNQLGAWQGGPHAGAYDTLATPEASAAGEAAGIANPQEAPECLRCHTTAQGVAAEHLGDGFDITKGVQCESCHGPGADYSPAGVMRDPEASLAAGMVVPNEAVCLTCHNSESPTFESFDFAERSAQIAHPNPQNAAE